MALQIPLSLPVNVSQWLVTPQNPPTSNSTHGMDYVRCAGLHNYIAELAWTGSGKSIDEMPRTSWFDSFGQEAEDVRGRFHPSVAQFLERAYEHYEPGVSFYYYTYGFSSPSYLWWLHDSMAMYTHPGEEGRIMTLYPTYVNLASKHDGLNFSVGSSYDQVTHKAVMRLDMFDSDYTDRNEALWFPLESILSAWVSEIQAGKIIPIPEHIEVENNRHHPWTYYSCPQNYVDETVDAFNRLTDAIESRLPHKSINNSASSPLLSHETLDAASVSQSGFLRSFLTTARKPKFKYIAPGLLVPTDDTFVANQHLTNTNADTEFEVWVAPFLLFRGDTRHTVKFDLKQGDSYPFQYEILKSIGNKKVPVGLYSEGFPLWSSNHVEDAFTLLLPYTVGDWGYARRSDMSSIKDKFSLYQQGYNPFGGGPAHPQRLVRLFENWLEMVESGLWSVNKDGVKGGIKKFKEADSNLWWKKYWIKMAW